MIGRSTLLLRVLLIGWLAYACEQARATAPTAPVLTRVSTTTKPTSGARGFLIEWEDKSNDEDFFVIYSRQGTSGKYGRVTQTSGPNITQMAFYSDRSFSVGTVFQFVVAACKGKFDTNRNVLDDTGGLWSSGDWYGVSESSALSNMLSTTWPDAASTWTAPTNLVATAPDDGHLKFTFTDNSNMEDRYEVQLKLTSDTATTSFKSFKDFFSLSGEYYWPMNLTTRTVAITLPPSTSYDFRIRAMRQTTTSGTFETTDWSNTATVSTLALRAASHFKAVANDELAINFSWDDNSSNESYYWLQFRTSGGTFDATGATNTYTVNANTQAISLSPFDYPDTAYDWRVVAVFEGKDTSNNKTYTLSPEAVASAVTVPFKAPTNLTATVSDDATSANSLVTLKWQDNSLVEQGFEVLYSIGGGADTSAGFAASKSGTGTATVQLSSLPAGQTLALKVRAYYNDSSGTTTITANSVASNSVTVQTKHSVSSNLHPAITKDAAFSYTLSTSSDATITSSSITNLPPGLSYDSGTRTITGTPSKGGLYLATIKVSFSGGSTATTTLQLRVVTPPAAPIKPVTIGSRTIGLNSPVYIPLADMFSDPDTEMAAKLTLQIGSGSAQDVVMILTPTLTPNTVQNFQNYVMAGDYNGTVFHRAPTISYPTGTPTTTYPFVVQGGGFKPAPESGNALMFAPVLDRSSPINEPGVPNLRGTIALAKKGGDPNSGTHDFFFSLDDRNSTDANGANLDTQNGGFTVFGRATTAGMTIMDTIYNLAKGSYTLTLRDPRGGSSFTGSTLSDFPVSGTTAPTTIDTARLVVIKKIVPIDNVLSYSTPSSSAPSKVTATILDGQLKLEGLVAGDSTIDLTATDLDGSTTTQSFTVTVDGSYSYPFITQHPVNVTVNELGNASFTVSATGTGPLSYQWRKDGVAIADGATSDTTTIAGATTATLSLTTVHLSDIAAYTVVVSNLATSTTSNRAFLTVSKTPQITTQPSSPGTKAYGSAMTLSVVATGTPSLQYQWRKGTTNISGATSASFTISSVKTTDAGSYSVRVTGGDGSFADSDAVTLSVSEAVDTDGDGLTDVYEDGHQLNKLKADTDGDGYSDGIEIQLGTNAAAASSHPGSKYYVAARDATSTLSSLLMKRISTSQLGDRLNGDATTVVQAYWLASTELTNKQFAAVLQYALKTMDNIDIISAGTGHAIRYPKTIGNTICYLGDYGGDSGTDILLDGNSATFYVPSAKANLPARAISWEGAYLATVVLNNLNNYTSKNTGGWGFSTGSNGYYIPTYLEWEAAARGAPDTNTTYPTGNTISTSLAWFNQLESTGPKNVASYKANITGCYDLGGNVAEWVQTFDSGTSQYYIRGGSFADGSSALLNTAHTLGARNLIDKKVGIRLALTGPATASTPTTSGGQLIRTDQPLVITSSSTGAPPLATQWLRNGSAISGQTSSTLTISSPTLATVGTYAARVTTNGVQPITSTVAPVSIVEVPTKLDYKVATPSDLTLTVRTAAATGHTLQYAWYKNGIEQTNDVANSLYNGFDTNTIKIKIGQASDTGRYTLVISEADGDVPATSVSFIVRVQLPPAFTTAPIFPKASVGQDFVYQPDYDFTTASKLPTSYSASGLPKGLSINTTTGVISGKPTEGGTFTVVITAKNVDGSTSTTSTTLVVQKLEVTQPNAIGRFFGTIARNTGAAPDLGLNDNLGGLIDVTTSKAGTFTGRLVLGMKSHSFSGALNATYKDPNLALPPNPTASVVIKRSGDTSLLLQFQIAIGELQTLGGTLYRLSADGTTATASASILAPRNPWNASTNPAGNYSGKHNVVLGPPTGAIGDAATPQGSGFTTINVATAGTTSWSGKLPDGTAFTFSGVMGAHGEHPIFASLYSGKGSLLGEAFESPDSGFHYFSGTDGISWLKKPQGTTNDRLYAAGIATALTPIGGLYTPAAGGNLIMGLAASTGSANARLAFTYGGLPGSPLTQDFIINAPSAVVMPGTTTPPSLSCTITNSSGNVSGRFTLADGRVVSYEALIVPDALSFGKGFARGYFKLPGLPSTTAPILSGRVDLTAKP